MEYAAHWRLHITAYVGMPGSAGHEFGILVGMNFQDFRVSFGAGRGGMNMKVTEAATEILVLLQRQFLIPEKNDVMIHQGVVDSIKRVVM